MKLSRTCCSLLLLAAPLAAQSVGVSLSAWTPLTATITDGVAISTNTWPAGPLGIYGSFKTSLPSTAGLVQATATWTDSAWDNGAFAQLEHVISNPGSLPTISASVGPHEFLVELTATAPVTADIKFLRWDQLWPGVGSPGVQLDYDNDGTIDVSSVSTLTPPELTRQYGPQPFCVRIIVNAALQGAPLAATTLRLIATPQNDLAITEIVAKCNPVAPSPPPFVQPSFVGQGITVSLAGLGVMVFGASPQPVLLGILSGVPCILVPSPDIVLFEPWGPLNVPLPASLRPLTFYAQGVELSSTSSLIPTEGYAITAF
jgi:hypothetical protein